MLHFVFAYYEIYYIAFDNCKKLYYYDETLLKKAD